MLYIGNHDRSQSDETRKALAAADGYLYLRLPEYALQELELIAEPEKQVPPVLLANVRALLHLRRWTDAEELSTIAALQHPGEEEFTVQRAFALHQLNKGDEAVAVLEAAPEWLRKTGILHYNLGCYEARLGDEAIARQCINTAIRINSAMKKTARIDPDLHSLLN